MGKRAGRAVLHARGRKHLVVARALEKVERTEAEDTGFPVALVHLMTGVVLAFVVYEVFVFGHGCTYATCPVKNLNILRAKEQAEIE